MSPRYLEERSFMNLHSDSRSPFAPPGSLGWRSRRLSTIASSTNLNKELPPLPSPTVSSASSSISSDFLFPYAPSARTRKSSLKQLALARPDSCTLPLTAAKPDFFLPEPEISDDFYPPDGDYDIRRRNAVHDRVRKWVDDRSSKSTSDFGDPAFQVAAWEEDDGDDGEELSPAFVSPVWEYPSRGHVLTHIVQPSNLRTRSHQAHHSIRPVLEFTSIAALTDAPAPDSKQPQPAHLSVPLSVGHSDLWSPIHATSPMSIKGKVPKSAPPYVVHRVPLQLASPSVTDHGEDADIPDDVSSQSSSSSSSPESSMQKHSSQITTNTKHVSSEVVLTSPPKHDQATSLLATPPSNEANDRPSSIPAQLLDHPREGAAADVVVPLSPSESEVIEAVSTTPLRTPIHSPERETNFENVDAARGGSATHQGNTASRSSSLRSVSRAPKDSDTFSISTSQSINYPHTTGFESSHRPDSLGGSTFGQGRSKVSISASRHSSITSIKHADTPSHGPPPLVTEAASTSRPSSPPHTITSKDGRRSASPSQSSSAQTLLVQTQVPLSSPAMQLGPVEFSSSAEPATPLSILKFSRDDVRSSFASASTVPPRVVTVVTVPRTPVDAGSVPSAVSSQEHILPIRSHVRRSAPGEPIARRIMTPIIEGHSTSGSSMEEHQACERHSGSDPAKSLPDVPTATEQSPSTVIDDFSMSFMEPESEERRSSLKDSSSILRMREPKHDTSAVAAKEDSPDRQTASPSGGIEGSVGAIRSLSERCIEGTLALIMLFSSCDLLADRDGIIKLCVAVRDSIEAVTRTLNAGPKREQDIQGASPSWRTTYDERLSSLHNNLVRMITFAKSLLQRPPRIDRLQDALEKLKAYIAKFSNLSVKLDSSHQKLRAQRAHAEMVTQRRSAQKLLGSQRREREWVARSAYKAPWREQKQAIQMSHGLNTIRVQ